MAVGGREFYPLGLLVGAAVRSPDWSHAVLVPVLLAATMAPLVAAAGAGTTSIGGSAPSSVPSADPTPTGTPETRHENPENRSEAGNLSMYQRWLAGRMGQVLIDCTSGASARQFGACDLQEDYPEWLGKYVDVARETETESDDRAADAFADAKDQQGAFDDQVASFWRTYEAYRRAREQGNTDRARRLARRLARVASGIDQTSTGLIRDYRRISNTSSVQMEDAESTVRNVTTNVTATADDVRATEFVSTRLSVRADATDTSFLDPLSVSGRLTTANGSAIADRSVLIAVGGQTILTRTDGDGDFELRYRPTTLRRDTDRLPVRYVPRNSSVYLPARATVPITVEQVRPNVTVSRRPATARFGETVVLAGSVSAGGINAQDIPVRVSIGSGGPEGGVARTVRTNLTGAYRTAVTVPAGLPDGERAVRATVALEDRALGPASATAEITVLQTNTSLSVNGTAAGSDGLRVEGRLTSVDGRPVEGQTVRVLVGGTSVGSVDTGAEGRYATTVAVPDGPGSGADATDRVRVVARFDGRRTNLEPARAATTVRFSGGAVEAGLSSHVGGVVDELLGHPVFEELASWSIWRWALVVGGVLTILASLGLVWLGLSGRALQGGRPTVALLAGRVLPSADGGGDPNGTTEAAGSAGGAAGESPDPPEPPDSPAESVSPLERAYHHLEREETDSAVETAYAVTRGNIATETGATNPTHWEFYDTASSQLPTDRVNLLHWLTEVYESAVFAPTAVGVDAARASIAVAERFENGTAQGTANAATGDAEPATPGSPDADQPDADQPDAFDESGSHSRDGGGHSTGPDDGNGSTDT